jgi:NAD(P)-dependent dehydrogenase (short-subunit alcohol dehydrogenase family)
MSERVIISISSDFGWALANDWLDAGFAVTGTYRTYSSKLDILKAKGATLYSCDLNNSTSIDHTCSSITEKKWEVLCIAPASLDPIGEFIHTDFDEWEASIFLNFTSQMRIINKMLPARDTATDNGPLVLLFAGGGTNSATKNYSAYTVSKIAQIKMTELLDAEIPDARFTIIGPGWVKTKIHESTIKAGVTGAGDNYQKTIDKLNEEFDTPMSRVVDCCNWVIGSKRKVVSGRNISLVFDKWGERELDELLINDPDMYKLRRQGN